MNDEERELYRQEVEWRSKEIEDLKFTLYKIRQAEALKKKPKNYLPMLGITGAFVFFSLIPGWNYGRNLDFNIVKNFNYLIINPFNEKILMTLGSTIIYIGFSVLALSIVNFLKLLPKLSIFSIIDGGTVIIWQPKAFASI